MSWDPGRVLRDLFNMIPGPRREIARPGIKESGTPLRSYGCCPACRAFCVISLSDWVFGRPLAPTVAAGSAASTRWGPKIDAYKP